MKVVWKGDEAGVPAVRLFGEIFPEGEAKDVSHLPKEFQEKLKHNICFRVVGDGDQAKAGKSTFAKRAAK